MASHWIIPNGFSFKDWISATARYSSFTIPPERPGVYVIVHKEILPEDSDSHIKVHILYIGSSKNLFSRFKSHEVFSLLKLLYHPIDFYFREEVKYKEEEKILIKKYSPKYNVVHNNIYKPLLQLKQNQNYGKTK